MAGQPKAAPPKVGARGSMLSKLLAPKADAALGGGGRSVSSSSARAAAALQGVARAKVSISGRHA